MEGRPRLARSRAPCKASQRALFLAWPAGEVWRGPAGCHRLSWLRVVRKYDLKLVPHYVHMRPSIVMILADDLGFNDVSLHGSRQIPTPHIDALAASGLTLSGYRTMPVCSPTRASIMSGRHAIHHGIYMPFARGSPNRLGLNYTLLPQFLQRLGYATLLAGKWHLGQNAAAALPINRGFDQSYGYWTGAEDHYTHQSPQHGGHYDFADGLRTCRSAAGHYGDDLFVARTIAFLDNQTSSSAPFFVFLALQNVHWPLQAPARLLARFANTTGGDARRQAVAAMAAHVDESVGAVTGSLLRNGLLESTLLLFLSDNGGPTNGNEETWASNYPLRGGKNTLWEYARAGKTHRTRRIEREQTSTCDVHPVPRAVCRESPCESLPPPPPESRPLEPTTPSALLRALFLHSRSRRGGTRAVAIASGFGVGRQLRGTRSDALLHATDWLPTLVHLASGSADWLGSEGSPAWRRDAQHDSWAASHGDEPAWLPGDGVDMLSVLADGAAGRDEIVLEAHPEPAMWPSALGLEGLNGTTNGKGRGRYAPLPRGYQVPTSSTRAADQSVHGDALVTSDGWKVLRLGSVHPQEEAGWVPPPGETASARHRTVACDTSRQPQQPPVRQCEAGSWCLFNIDEDPCEYRDLAGSRPDVLNELRRRLAAYQRTAVPPIAPVGCDPIVVDGAWRPCDLPLHDEGRSF